MVITAPSPAHWEQVPRWAVALGCMIRSLKLPVPCQPHCEQLNDLKSSACAGRSTTIVLHFFPFSSCSPRVLETGLPPDNRPAPDCPVQPRLLFMILVASTQHDRILPFSTSRRPRTHRRSILSLQIDALHALISMPLPELARRPRPLPQWSQPHTPANTTPARLSPSSAAVAAGVTSANSPPPTCADRPVPLPSPPHCEHDGGRHVARLSLLPARIPGWPVDPPLV